MLVARLVVPRREGSAPAGDGRASWIARSATRIWERVQALFYEDAARIRLGDYFRLDARRKDVQGYRPGPYMHFWNVWLEK